MEPATLGGLMGRADGRQKERQGQPRHAPPPHDEMETPVAHDEGETECQETESFAEQPLRAAPARILNAREGLSPEGSAPDFLVRADIESDGNGNILLVIRKPEESAGEAAQISPAPLHVGKTFGAMRCPAFVHRANSFRQLVPRIAEHPPVERHFRVAGTMTA